MGGTPGYIDLTSCSNNRRMIGSLFTFQIIEASMRGEQEQSEEKGKNALSDVPRRLQFDRAGTAQQEKDRI